MPSLRPQVDEHAAEAVGAEPRHVGDARTEPRGGDRHVRRVAAESLQIRVRVRRASLVELDQRLAERDDVSHCAGSRSACRCRRRPPARRGLRVRTTTLAVAPVDHAVAQPAFVDQRAGLVAQVHAAAAADHELHDVAGIRIVGLVRTDRPRRRQRHSCRRRRRRRRDGERRRRVLRRADRGTERERADDARRRSPRRCARRCRDHSGIRRGNRGRPRCRRCRSPSRSPAGTGCRSRIRGRGSRGPCVSALQ